MRVLVVDDSERVRKTLATGLKARGMAVETAADGAEALSLLNGLSFDLIVLDLMMPRMDGTQVLQALKSKTAKPRILVLSARDQVQDRVDALNLGADDYLVKPFAFEELLARLLALGRRSVAEASPEITCGRLVMDTATRLARVDDTALSLTPKEYALLELLVRRKGHVLSRSPHLRAAVRKRQRRVRRGHRGVDEHAAGEAVTRRPARPDRDPSRLRLCRGVTGGRGRCGTAWHWACWRAQCWC